MFTRKQSYWKFAGTFALGSLTGAVVALLFAPMTGKRLQRKVADVTGTVIEKVGELQQTVRKLATA